jgi:hypothetical protein
MLEPCNAFTNINIRAESDTYKDKTMYKILQKSGIEYHAAGRGMTPSGIHRLLL